MSTIRDNAEKDPTYAPYCGRCPGLHRMSKVEPFYWRHSCGAEHDERDLDDVPLEELEAASDIMAHLEAGRLQCGCDSFDDCTHSYIGDVGRRES